VVGDSLAKGMLPLRQDSQTFLRPKPGFLSVLYREPPAGALDAPGPRYAWEMVLGLLADRNEVLPLAENPITRRALGFSRLPAAG
jgi:hypothetical protein